MSHMRCTNLMVDLRLLSLRSDTLSCGSLLCVARVDTFAGHDVSNGWLLLPCIVSFDSFCDFLLATVPPYRALLSMYGLE